MDKEYTELMKIFEKEYGKKQKERDKINLEIEQLELKKKVIIFDALKKAMKIYDKK